MKRNPCLAHLRSSYLFPEINQRKKDYLMRHPDAPLISLGVGDSTEPLSDCVAHALTHASASLGTREGYSGYGPEQGQMELRVRIAEQLYQNRIHAHEVFVSDGAKCDLGRLQTLFGPNVSIAVQDPAYPVYVEGSLIQGVQKIVYMPCHPSNNFFPDLTTIPRTDLIYFCSPNNPTGAVATREQLEQLVAFAKANGSIIIFDSAYASYIQDPELPKSIYEIEGAKEVAIEVGSFSKLAGFTGVRLGWTVVPDALKYDDGSSVKADWNRLMTTIFNGASNIAQRGGCAVLCDEGLKAISAQTQFYLKNAALLKEAFEAHGCQVYGGVNAPYLWVAFPKNSSWDVFQLFLEKFHLICTPGAGFGDEGEGFVRFSAFGSRAHIEEAASRLKNDELEAMNSKFEPKVETLHR